MRISAGKFLAVSALLLSFGGPEARAGRDGEPPAVKASPPARAVHQGPAVQIQAIQIQAVEAGGFLFTAGQIPLDPVTMDVVPGDVGAQTEQVLKNLSAVIGAAGADWSHVVKTTVFLRDMADFAAMNAVYARVLGEAKPARSTVAVLGLPRDVRVEIEAVVAL